MFLPEDWSQIFVPDTPVLEMVIRGTIVYLFLFFLLRVVLQRESSGVGITDLLVIVLLADAAQNAMGDGYQSIPGGLILVSTIVGWAWFLGFLAHRFRGLRGIIKPHPIPLIKEGQLIDRNVRRELLTHDEIMGHLREQGVESISDVKHAYMESDGIITAVPYQRKPGQGGTRQRRKFLH